MNDTRLLDDLRDRPNTRANAKSIKNIATAINFKQKLPSGPNGIINESIYAELRK